MVTVPPEFISALPPHWNGEVVENVGGVADVVSGTLLSDESDSIAALENA
jgi:hypothetical protein